MTEQETDEGTRAEVGFNESTEKVYLKHAGEKAWMQPDEARQFANLLMQSAEAAEGSGSNVQ